MMKPEKRTTIPKTKKTRRTNPPRNNPFFSKTQTIFNFELFFN